MWALRSIEVHLGNTTLLTTLKKVRSNMVFSAYIKPLLKFHNFSLIKCMCLQFKYIFCHISCTAHSGTWPLLATSHGHSLLKISSKDYGSNLRGIGAIYHGDGYKTTLLQLALLSLCKLPF